MEKLDIYMMQDITEYLDKCSKIKCKITNKFLASIIPYEIKKEFKEGIIEVFNYHIGYHISQNMINRLDERRLIENACQGGNIEIVEMLFGMFARRDIGFLGACKGGHKDIVEFLIAEMGMTGYNLEIGLYYACLHGHMDIINILTKYNHGYDFGLSGACDSGNLEIIELMISLGANDWNGGMNSACFGGHMNIIELMIGKGANNWDKCLCGACGGGHMNVVEYMIKKGARNWSDGLECACKHKHQEIIELMVRKGARFCEHCRQEPIDHLKNEK